MDIEYLIRFHDIRFDVTEVPNMVPKGITIASDLWMIPMKTTYTEEHNFGGCMYSCPICGKRLYVTAFYANMHLSFSFYNQPGHFIARNLFYCPHDGFMFTEYPGHKIDDKNIFLSFGFKNAEVGDSFFKALKDHGISFDGESDMRNEMDHGQYNDATIVR